MERILDKLEPKSYLRDETHLHRNLTLAAFNLVLNAAVAHRMAHKPRSRTAPGQTTESEARESVWGCAVHAASSLASPLAAVAWLHVYILRLASRRLHDGRRSLL